MPQILKFTYMRYIKMLMVLVAMAAMAVSAYAQSGTCGDNLNWSYDETTHVLTITDSYR